MATAAAAAAPAGIACWQPQHRRARHAGLECLAGSPSAIVVAAGCQCTTAASRRVQRPPLPASDATPTRPSTLPATCCSLALSHQQLSEARPALLKALVVLHNAWHLGQNAHMLSFMMAAATQAVWLAAVYSMVLARFVCAFSAGFRSPDRFILQGPLKPSHLVSHCWWHVWTCAPRVYVHRTKCELQQCRVKSISFVLCQEV